MSQQPATHVYPVGEPMATDSTYNTQNTSTTSNIMHSNQPISEKAQGAANNAAGTAQNVASNLANNASNAYNAAANSQLAQNVKNTVANGPVAENVKAEAARTTNELSNLANARNQRPQQRAATGQHLTHYHSFFFSLLSWENPRATAVAYAAAVIFIFGARYLDLLRYAFKITWMTLGLTAVAEVAGKSLFNTGFVSQIRPRRYYTVPKETLDSMTGDIDELINFFVIESQRLVFAENVFATLAAFVSAFISYYLIKIVPLWGLTLIGTSVLFLTPLIYKQNKELIDHQIAHASRVVNQQTVQVKQLATQHASNAAATTKHFVDDYTHKAQEIIGSKTGSRVGSRSVSPTISKQQNPISTTTNTMPHVTSDVNTSGPMDHNIHSSPLDTGAASSNVQPVGAAAVYDEKPSGDYAMRQEDFPQAPKTDITTGAPVQDTTAGLRSENKPLYN